MQYTYQWVRNDGAADTDISGATAQTYTLTSDDQGNTVKVTVSFTEDDGYAETLTSAATGSVSRPANVAATGQPAITGTAQVGETLRADTSGISDTNGLTNVQYTYQWVRNDGAADTDISGATAQTYTLTSDDQGNTVKVTVSFTDDDGYVETLTSAAMSSVASRPNSAATGMPTITGAVHVGGTLTADTSGIADTDGMNNATFSYQWVANDGSSDTDIAGATNTTYSLAAAEEGKTIKVRVGFTDDAGHVETLTSAATALVIAEPLSITGNDSPEYPENESTSVATYSVEPSNNVDWSIEGDDSAVFSIADGVLEFPSPPNYERPADKTGDNEYEIEIVATDSSDTRTARAVMTCPPKTGPWILRILRSRSGGEDARQQVHGGTDHRGLAGGGRGIADV